MKDKYNNEIKKITIDNKVKEQILNRIENRKTTHKFKFAYTMVAVFLLLATFSVVYAKEIKEFITSWTTHVEFKNDTKIEVNNESGFKNIPDNAPKVEKPQYVPGQIKPEKPQSRIEMNHDQIEEILGFHILDYANTYTKTIYYDTGLNDNGNIGRVDLWWGNFVKENDNKYISVLVSMLNLGADKKYVLAFEEGLDASGEKELNDIYQIKNLDTKAVIYGNDWDSSRLTATFVYDDILYQFIGNNYSKEEMINILEKLY